jgi:acyl-CoA synthetase (NDP forming)
VTAKEATGAAFREVDAIFRARSLALVGASEAGWTATIFRNLRASGATAAIYPVNPKRERVWGERCYPSFAAIPEAVDLALTIVPAAAVAPALREGAAHGLRAAIVYAAGFGEGGDAAGAERAAELGALADAGLRVCGPNCMGTLSLRERLLLYPSTRVRDVEAGNVALAMQSGGLFQYWLQYATARGLGFSYAASVGNELDCDVADYLNFFIADEQTRVICCFIEGVRRPAAFLAAAAAALAARKPIVLVKSGRSDRAKAAVQSHTGSLAGDDRVFDAVCERYGIIRAATLDEMIEHALVLRTGRLPRATGGVMTLGYSGAARGLFLDAAADAGLAFAPLAPATRAALAPLLDPAAELEMPVDLGAGMAVAYERFAEVCALVAADPNCALLAVQAQLPVNDETLDPQWFRGLAERTEQPIMGYARIGQSVDATGRAFAAATGLPFVQGVPETVRVARALMRYAARARRGIPAASADRHAHASIAAGLRAHGIELPREGVAAGAAAAADLAAEIGFPVAVKLHAPGALHKTEVDGVRVGLAGRDAVERAAAELLAIAAARPELGCDGVLVQAMAAGLEMIVGARNDPQFGPVILAGVGGIFVEAYDDVALRLLPIDLADADAMLDELRGRALLGPLRGRPARDVDALAAAIVAVGALFLECAPALADLEINPLIVREAGRGACAVDVRVVEGP